MRKTKIKVHIFFQLLVLTAFWSCNSGERGEEREATVGPGQIVLVFEDSVTHQFFRQRKALFKYMDDNMLPVEISFNSDESSKDLIINTKRGSLDLVYRDNSQVEFTYYLQNGDSILILEKDKKPWFESVKKESSYYTYNLELLRNTELYVKSHSKAQDFYFLWNETKTFPFELDMNEDLRRNKEEAIQGFQKELYWIDSLGKEGLISEEVKAFYISKNRMEQKKLEAYDPESLDINTQTAINSFLEKDNSLLAPRVFLDEFSELIITNQTELDSKALLDSLIASGELSSNEKSLLFHYLQKEIPYLSFKEADEVLVRYGDKLANPAQLVLLNSSNKALQGVEPDIELMGLQKSSITFEEILRQKKGKYLYVDLRAAWCIPCIKAFPASLALNEAYKSKGVEVIFLSVDDNYKFWEEVANKYDIAIPEQSFVAMNKDESEYLKALDEALIPRYLIFDPEGKLIHPNAPRPDTEEIRDFLDSLIDP
ncbi:TlpA family protein disulfide reductase [Algoriphagus chordae]|uniref:Thiol-disulfide isomerase/thioredoxin n=1 Tax=Algoriphagus chordae TaxID=237019 RepID=A0A2W7QK93_9BACT|nr:TlpA disulfide reductase family protein [Algoriphagus chordae]PZX46400.1 thiol-disulfide isomerase/thioredoxin [Algoriphagus chordae]